MTGPEHYREAELSLETAAKCIDGTVTLMTAEQAYAEAQVHATLALAAATVDLFALYGQVGDVSKDEWRKAVTS
jgi:hypothetical protein